MRAAYPKSSAIKRAALAAGVIFALLAMAWLMLPCHIAYGATELAGSSVSSNASHRLATASSQGCLNVKKYAIRAKIDTEDDLLDLTVTATVKNNTSKTFSSLYFRNMAASMIAQAKAEAAGNDDVKTKVQYAKNLSGAGNLKHSLSKRDPSIVKVRLGKNKLRPGKTIRIQLKVKTGIPYWIGRFGYTDTSKGRLYSLCWCYPYLADYRDGKWTLSPLPKIGENRFARATKYDVTITAPKKYKVVTSGVSTTKNGKTRVKASGLRDFAVVACNYLKKETATVRGVKINNWYLPGKYASRYRKDIMVALKDAVSYMTDHVGACSLKEIDVVQVFGGTFGDKTGSMEYPGLVTLQGDAYYYKSGRGGTEVGFLTCTAFHEMIHQWFFATVGNDEFAEPWLDEGIASYYNRWALWAQPSNTVKYLAAGEGKSVEEYLAAQQESYRTSLSNAEYGATSCKLNRNANSFESYFATVYSTSAWFLVQLEETAGKATFESIMRDYYSTYRLKEATTAGFLAIVRKHADNSDVEALIAKYFD